MPIEFQCPACANRLRVPDDCAGRSARCPECGQICTVDPNQEAPKQSPLILPGESSTGTDRPKLILPGGVSELPTPAPELQPPAQDAQLRQPTGDGTSDPNVISTNPLVVRAVLDDVPFVTTEDGRFVNVTCGHCGTLQHHTATFVGRQVECVQCGTLNQLPGDVAHGVWNGIKATGRIAGALFGAWVDAMIENSDHGHGPGKRPCPRCGYVCADGIMINDERCPNCNARLS